MLVESFHRERVGVDGCDACSGFFRLDSGLTSDYGTCHLLPVALYRVLGVI